jgi:hypothetical protein
MKDFAQPERKEPEIGYDTQEMSMREYLKMLLETRRRQRLTEEPDNWPAEGFTKAVESVPGPKN